MTKPKHDSFPRRLPRAPDMSSDDALFNAEALIRLEEDSDDAPQPVALTQLELRRTRSQTSQLSVASSPSLSSSTTSSAWFSTTSSARSQEIAQLRTEIAKLRQENAGLKLESASIKAQRDAAQAHAVFAGQQVAVYKHRYNSKVNKKESSKKVTTSARVLTSREVRKEIEQDAAKKVQKQKLEAERETRKAEAEEANIIRHAEQERLGTQFSGNLNSMSKKVLVDIAFSLKVPSKDVTQDALRVRLQAHFDAHEELKKHPRYIGIFERTRKRKDPPSGSNPGPSSLIPGLSSLTPGPSSFAPGPSLYPPSIHHSSFAPPPFFGQFQLSLPPLHAQNYNPSAFENQFPSTLHQSITPIYTVPPPLPYSSSSQSLIPPSSSILQPHPRPCPRPVPHRNVDNPA